MNLWTNILWAGALLVGSSSTVAQQSETWRYFRVGNTGIQGDFNEAIHVGADGDPWIGGYDPFFEEGGVAKFLQAQNRWINVSNVDYPVIGHPNDTGSARVSDIVADGTGRLWMGTWRGALSFDPAVGPTSLVRHDETNSTLSGGRTVDVALAPDGSIVFSSMGGTTINGGITRYVPATDTWSYLGIQGGKIATQPRPGGGFYVWASEGGSFGGAARWDSTTQAWTSYPLTAGEPRQLISTDSADALGNVWMLRMVNTWDTQLDCIRPDGTWITPPLPPLPVGPVQIAAVRAFGNFQALLVDCNRILHRFDGTAWTSLGLVPQFSSYIDDMEIDAAGNVWMVGGTGGAVRRDAVTGAWQHYRITNTGNSDNFNGDLAIDTLNGHVYATANAGPGVGGMVRFDGQRWTPWNQLTYGLGFAWPFATDNCRALVVRPSNGRVVVSPADWIHGVHEWNGTSFQQLTGLDGASNLVEDSLARVWALGGTIGLGYFNGLGWTSVPGASAGGDLERDPTRPGTVWAMNGGEIARTDGTYLYRRTVDDFPPLSSFSDTFTGFAADHNGVAWTGGWTQFTSTGGVLIRLDADTGTHQMWQHDLGWPFPGEHVAPLLVTPDGRVWMLYFSEYPSNDNGLCWFDGTNVGVYPAPPGGIPQWGGFPHASLNDIEMREIPGGYELWMSFGSRGIASLTVLGAPLVSNFCAGDGTGLDCACGNNGAAGRGCAHASNPNGASLTGAGGTSLAGDSLVLSGSGMPNGPALYFQGTAQVNGGLGVAFGDGQRCAGGTVIRLAVRTNVAGASHYPAGAEPSVSAKGLVTAPGTRTYQVWYRDSAPTFCTAATFNLTNGLSVSWLP